jgi:site-specific recombinase XerD
MLGHRNIATTMNFYVGLENIQATEIYANLMKKRLDESLEEDE